MNMILIWGILAAVFLVIELLTVGMVSIWFLLGAVCALILAVIRASIWLQLLTFILISVLSFLLIYPRLKNLVRSARRPTNADMIIGQSCYVTRRISNIEGQGAVSVGGKTWTARSAGADPIEEGTLVTIREIQGVKVIVVPASD